MVVLDQEEECDDANETDEKNNRTIRYDDEFGDDATSDEASNIDNGLI